jgi:hypothetical protein
MKAKVSLLLGIVALIPCLASVAEPSEHREITRWTSSPLGSHLGSGYASTYLTNIRAKTTVRDEAKLREAINTLDGLGMIEVRGFGLLPAAVAWQAQISIHELVAEQAQTGLSYGELLMAHTLASNSGRNFHEILALRTAARSWGQLAEQLAVSPETIIRRAQTASDRIRLAETRTRQRGQRDPSLQTTNPNLHHYFAIH